MEVDACDRLLEFLKLRGVKVAVFASDRSISVRKMMKEKHPDVRHQFDPWLFSCYFYFCYKVSFKSCNDSIIGTHPTSIPPHTSRMEIAK